MKVIVVTGGKGGTGKTVLAVNLAVALAKLTGGKVLLVDVDVDNPCTYTLLRPELKTVREVKSFRPLIDESKCSLCGLCVEHCMPHALVLIPGHKLLYLETLCEGCAACLHVCPKGAITRGESLVGWVKAWDGGWISLIVGELKPGDRRYHEVMEETLEYAAEAWSRGEYSYVIIDTPPGTGKGILFAIKAADIVVAVTEPTRLGLNDLVKLHGLLDKLGKREIVVLNKYGLPGGVDREIEAFALNKGLAVAKVRYDAVLLKAYVNGLPVVESYPKSPAAVDILKLAKLLAR